MKLTLFACSLLGVSDAFAPISRFPQGKVAFHLFAASGAPQYDKVDAVLREAEVLAEGSVMLHIDCVHNETKLEYQPGHVVALEIQPDQEVEEIQNEKLVNDMKNNGGWMRGPYTLTRSTDHSIDILIRVVGDKSERMASAPANTPVKFGGKFKVPILEGIDTSTTKRIVLLSTGVGAGPCVGAIEAALQQDNDSAFPPIELYASYKNKQDIVYSDHLDELAKEHAEKFQWKPVITSEFGRISASEEGLQNLLLEKPLQDTHFHLIGNGQMVQEFKAGLAKGGIPNDKITIEMYFNHKATPEQEVIDRIAAFVSKHSLVATK